MNRPLIGVTMALDVPECRMRVMNHYATALERAGADCVYLPLATPALCASMVPRLDGLILSGGGDIPEHMLHEPLHPASKPIPRERWDSECRWLNTALAREIPVLGVCLGMQILCVAAGGTILQDIPSQRPGALAHRSDREDLLHPVHIDKGSRLAHFARTEEALVTSSHHQAVINVPSPYGVTARTPDGIIEGIEREGNAFVVGAQWHPERNPGQPDWLLLGFTAACAAR